MAFLQKTWKDRVAEYINRRVLTKEDGTTELVSVERSEGTISQEGDAFSAANMNDLEQRIANEFSEQNKKINSDYKLDETITISPGYVAPSDGYFTVVLPYGGSGVFTLYLNGYSVLVTPTATGNTIKYSIFVKKGMTITFTNNTGKTATTEFVPIKSV